MPASGSTAVTSAPSASARAASSPVPAPTSSTRAPAPTPAAAKHGSNVPAHSGANVAAYAVGDIGPADRVAAFPPDHDADRSGDRRFIRPG